MSHLRCQRLPAAPQPPGSVLFRGGRRVRREGARGAAGRLPGAAGGIRCFPSSVLPARPSSLPRAEGTGGGWFRGWPEPAELPGAGGGGGGGRPAGRWGPRLGVPGGERPRRFGTTKKRYNYATGYKLTLCTAESYWIFVMCSFPNRCSL